MIAIAESGSTKTDWVWMDQGEIVFRHTTIGFNPHIVDSSFISKTIQEDLILKERSGLTSSLFFYGAGCSTPNLNQVVADGLSTLFKQSEIQVKHDLLGAARASWNGSPGLTCILGTGSNICYFDGKKIKQNKPSLGYLLADEGSGKALGGRLFREVLHKVTPEPIRQAFIAEHLPDYENAIATLYNQDRPNRYLASFVPFIHARKHEDYFKALIGEEFKRFFDVYVRSYNNWEKLPCHFIGSIGIYFQDELKQVLQEEQMQAGAFIQKPIDQLALYHHQNT